MKKNYHGVVVPMVTPLTPAGAVDLPAAHRIVEHLLQGDVDGVFALGTTGEGASVPQAEALRLVKSIVQQVGGRALVYAGVNNNCISDAATTGNQYLIAGADALVLLPPSYFPLQPAEMFFSIKHLLDQLEGPAFLYNIPATTHHSIPLDIVEKLLGHPRLVGLKDSENDAQRLEKLVARFSECPDFSVFIGVGIHMARMLSLGADGIVPSVGNLVPEICTKLAEHIRRDDPAGAARLEIKMMAAASLYQRGRTLGGSLSALKAAMNSLELCDPTMFPPLLTLDEKERKLIRQEMVQCEIGGSHLASINATTSHVMDPIPA